MNDPTTLEGALYWLRTLTPAARASELDRTDVDFLVTSARTLLAEYEREAKAKEREDA